MNALTLHCGAIRLRLALCNLIGIYGPCCSFMKLRLFLRQLGKCWAWGEGGDTREVYSYLRCSNSIQRILFFCYCRGQQKPVWSCLIDKPRRLDKQRKQTETANSEGQGMGGGGRKQGTSAAHSCQILLRLNGR